MIKKSVFYQILKLSFFLLLINISSLYSHNLFNGGYDGHSIQNIKAINDKKNLKNFKNQIDDDESKNSCLNKSLCRG